MDLHRFESVGDNCEFGFVLQRLGSDRGGLFRWARADAPQVAAALNNGLHNMYEDPAPRPNEPGMVNDARFGIGWHTTGDLASERERVNFLAARFCETLRSGTGIFVFKAHGAHQRGQASEIQAALTRLADGASFHFLEVWQSADERPGVVEVGADRMIGFVSRFAPYDHADHAAYDDWRIVLQGAESLAERSDMRSAA